MAEYFTIRWLDGKVSMIDQRILPRETVYLEYEHYIGVAQAIRDMVIRGAPAIGAAAAYGLALAAACSKAKDLPGMRRDLEAAAEVLLASRPTAVNLFWAVNRMMTRLADPALESIEAIQTTALNEARAIADEDIETNKQIGINGLSVIPPKAGIVHHCNTGALATVDYGTALGVIRTAHEHGREIHVYVDETRPRLQGARLTSWELQQLGIPHTVIVDGASGHFMRLGKVQLCLVGCDRIAANGDTANKIGTYNLALVAHAHGIPFYIVGPTTTIDYSIPDGSHIPIEERNAQEVTHVGDCQITPDNVQVANPAFDVTLARYITGIITEKGIAYPPFTQSLANFR
jgi:methylthioribose-1-phosphate isomerase